MLREKLNKMTIYEDGNAGHQLIFALLGACMLGLFVSAILNFFTQNKFDVDLMLILLITGALSAFCIRRAFVKKFFAVYPKYIIVNGKKIKWSKINGIYFNQKKKLLSVTPSKEFTIQKQIMFYIIMITFVVLLTILSIKIKNPRTYILAPIIFYALGLDRYFGLAETNFINKKQFNKAFEIVVLYANYHKIPIINEELADKEEMQEEQPDDKK